jgi:uncharacterized protein YdaU (DUF1376 family)
MSGTRAKTWMPLYIGDYLADTMHLSFAEHGAYLLLIFAYWRTGTALPSDDKKLAGICKASAEEWRALKPTLSEFFQISDGTWRHGRIEKELADAQAGYEKRRAAAEARWLHSKSNADAMHEQPQSHSHSSLRSEVVPPDVPLGRSRGTRLAADWEPDPEDRAFAEQLGLQADAVSAEYRDYWIAVPGSKGCKLDWHATWRTWCRRASRDAANSNGRSGRMVHRQGPNSLIAAARAVAAQIEGEQ